MVRNPKEVNDMWRQFTFKNGTLAYEPKDLTNEQMVARFAQIMFLKQAGEDISLSILEHDDMWNAIKYEVVRINGDGIEVKHIYTKTA